MGSIPRSARFLAAALLALAQLLTVGTVSPVAAADPIRVDVCLTDSASAALVPDTTFYQINSGPTSFFAATVTDRPAASTTTSTSLPGPPASRSGRRTTTRPARTSRRTSAPTPTFNFQTSAITVRVQDASSTGIAGAQVRFGASGSGGGTYYYPGQPTGASGDVFR